MPCLSCRMLSNLHTVWKYFLVSSTAFLWATDVKKCEMSNIKELDYKSLQLIHYLNPVILILAATESGKGFIESKRQIIQKRWLVWPKERKVCGKSEKELE